MTQHTEHSGSFGIIVLANESRLQRKQHQQLPNLRMPKVKEAQTLCNQRDARAEQRHKMGWTPKDRENSSWKSWGRRKEKEPLACASIWGVGFSGSVHASSSEKPWPFPSLEHQPLCRERAIREKSGLGRTPSAWWHNRKELDDSITIPVLEGRREITFANQCHCSIAESYQK